MSVEALTRSACGIEAAGVASAYPFEVEPPDLAAPKGPDRLGIKRQQPAPVVGGAQLPQLEIVIPAGL